MESIDPAAPDIYVEVRTVEELEKKIDHLAELFLYHIHSVNDMLGVTSTPRRRIDFTEPLEK